MTLISQMPEPAATGSNQAVGSAAASAYPSGTAMKTNIAGPKIRSWVCSIDIIMSSSWKRQANSWRVQNVTKTAARPTNTAMTRMKTQRLSVRQRSAQAPFWASDAS
jgi:hypothetical protein